MDKQVSSEFPSYGNMTALSNYVSLETLRKSEFKGCVSATPQQQLVILNYTMRSRSIVYFDSFFSYRVALTF